MVLPWTSDAPNRSPSPLNACAAALRVAFNFTGSTCSEIAVMVSNSVLNSVVTPATSIGLSGEIRCGLGLSGEVKATYLLPNTVVAPILTSTLAGMSPT